MDEQVTTRGYPEQPKVDVDSPPLSPRSSDDDDDETEPDDSDGEEEEGGAGVGTSAAVVSGPPLKKGPWTPDEDKHLRTYVEAHGEGNWNKVQKNAGLNRCGKSCRLRWANHLRPHLKKGPFSKDEEQLIIELHAKHGNKWAQMAGMLPGRTDNEIKNFWNTRSKRCLKNGQELYPDGLLSRVANQEMDSHSPDDSCGKKRPNELSQGNSLEFDDIIFEKLDYKKRSENLLALPSDAINPSKRHAYSDMVSGYGGSPTCEQFPHEPERTCYTDFNLAIKMHGVPYNSAIANGLQILDVNFSTSGSMQRPMKMELPSVQCPSYEPINSWECHMPPATLLGLADTFISSPASVLQKTDCFPSQNNGLLGAMVQQGHVLGDPTKFQGVYELSVPPVAYVYPLSEHSSVFDANLLEGSPLDGFTTSKSPASLVSLLEDSTQQADDIFVDKYLSPLPDPCRPGASAEVGSFNQYSPHSEYQQIHDPFSDILFRDSSDQVTLSAPGDGHEHRLESGPWNSMPGARHVPGS